MPSYNLACAVYLSIKTDMTDSRVASQIVELEERLSRLEYNAKNEQKIINLDDPVERVKADLQQRSVFTSIMITVPSTYYSWTLEERANILNCHVNQLCKSIILENTACTEKDCTDPTNSKYYCVVLQYNTKLDEDKLRSIIINLRPNKAERLSKSKVALRLVASETNDKMTGFSHNAVCPFGINTELGRSVPIILSKALHTHCTTFHGGIDKRSKDNKTPNKPTPNHYLYLGGGHVDVKLGMAIGDFMRISNCIIGDITNSREAQEEEDE